MHIACLDCSSNILFSNIWGRATLKKLRTERRLCGTKFGIGTLTFAAVTLSYPNLPAEVSDPVNV